MQIEYLLDDIDAVAQKILDNNPNKVILFNGNMGVGKTTLIKHLVQKIGINDVVNSPTFSLVNEYQSTNNQTVYHFDFYRIKNQNEALDIGIDDYIYSGNWCFIEWAENIQNLIPKKHSIVKIELLTNQKRHLTLT